VKNQMKEWATVDSLNSVYGFADVRMARISWATRGLQWLGQCDATPKGEANRLNPTLVRIGG